MRESWREPLFSNFTPLRRAKQRLTVSTSRTALVREKWSPREKTRQQKDRALWFRDGGRSIWNSRRKFYQVFDLLEEAGGLGLDEAMRSGFEKGRLENAALSLLDPRIGIGSPSLRYVPRANTMNYCRPSSHDLESPITKESRPGISFAIISSRSHDITRYCK